WEFVCAQAGAPVTVDEATGPSGFFRLITGQFNDSTHDISIRLNQVAGGSSAEEGNITRHTIDVGARGGTVPFIGDIGEIAIYKSPLSAAQRDQVEAYLTAK